ncbi:DUF551 domain-containing protein [Paenibacillus oenotherae]|uniref:DUF551 domain-containing protein n=1 Tax=Paenibacillus oenotherae TaxID=1435645 RepID=A0ABS7D7M3_9BACL|nr:DUF551 domain-containing protein [Paenibacillus oenotherae]MBW7475934.1 DUF551 domain-containing protein [Paenibacillus oenotherae]
MSEWIKCSERLPEPAQRVLAVFLTGHKDNQRISLVVYVPAKKVKAEDLWNDDSGDCVEYDEENDCYYIDEGWYESSYESETDWKLTCEVTHWMPLPQVPSKKEVSP